MTMLIDDAAPTIMAKLLTGNRLRVACPHCRGPSGSVRYHEHGTGGRAGPWHRLAHCCDADLPPQLLNQRRNGRTLAYTIVEQQAIDAPPLAPDAPVARNVYRIDGGRYER